MEKLEGDYFEKSQVIKVELENCPSLIHKIKTGEGLEWMASGGRNHLLRIGQLPSGLWIALRESEGFEREKDPQLGLIGMFLYESYCIEAEQHYAAGKRVPFVMGGYVAESETPFLVVEDLTENDRWIVRGTAPGYCRGIRESEGKREYVWFDLGKDDTIQMGSEIDEIEEGKLTEQNLKYFHPNARLNL